MDIVFQDLTSDKKYNQRFFDKIFIVAGKELKLNKKKIELSMNLVGESRIKELNRKYRGKNKITDVLSFPMDGKYTIHNTRYIIHDLGDIFICFQFAKKEAKRENIPMENKLAQLTVHGFLHLLGYDHERSRKEAKKMFSLEKKILSKVIFN